MDCGATLGEKLSDAQEAEYQLLLSENIEDMYNRNDPLYVGLFDKIVGAIAILGCVASIMFPFLWPYTLSDDHPYLWAFILCAIAAVDAFFPQLTWGLEKLRLGLWVNGADDLEPSHLYLVGRRVGVIVALAIGIALLLLACFPE
ncbi:MAG: hypothetical protein IKU98_05840 [Bacteroidaceae bacterium]|nr:hypothetical protein [Bacteroidaceae bacterium]